VVVTKRLSPIRRKAPNVTIIIKAILKINGTGGTDLFHCLKKTAIFETCQTAYCIISQPSANGEHKNIGQ
jgi:hypothetical protein